MAKTTSNSCLLCDASTKSSRNSFAIFTQAVSSSDKKLVQVLSSILNIQLKENRIHSVVVCKKCYRVTSEIDELQDRIEDLKQSLIENYEKSLRKQTEGILEFEDDEDTKEDSDIFDPAKPAATSKKKNKSAVDQTPPKTQSRTVVTVKIADMEDISKPDASHTNTEEENEMSELVTPEDDESDDDDDRIEEILEADLREGELPLKFEVTEETLPVKRGRGRPRKTEPNKVPEVTLTPDMVLERGSENTYTCMLCTNNHFENKFYSDKDIITHVRMEHKMRVYICDMCGQEFLKRNLFQAHLDEHLANSADSEYQCDVCNRIFYNLKLYRVHRKVHLAQVNYWCCELCGKKFRSRAAMEEHVLNHTGDRPHQCSICDKTFASKYSFKSHQKTHTKDRDRPFPCVNCGKSFFTQQNLIQHEHTHSSMKEFICSECGKAFGTARNLEVHLAVHSGKRPFICRLCGKAFTRKAEVIDHERTHTGERPFQCELCGSQFSQKSNLLSHKRATHFNDKRYPCVQCTKAFKRRRLLDYHIKSAHTGERPFKCDLCSASFIYPEHFKKHKHTHTGEKPYQCEVCGKAFNSRDNRNAHRFVHSDKKPYECIVCGAGFMRKPLLYAHMKYQGHETETIVVNQPRLVLDEYNDMGDDKEANIEMTLVQEPDGSHKLVPLHMKTEIEEIEDSNLSEDGQQFIIRSDDQIEINSDMEAIEVSEITDLGSDNEVINESPLMETEDGPVHLVQIRLPDEKGQLRETWLDFASQNH